MKTHNWPLNMLSLRITKNYNKSYAELEQNYDNFILIKYEDLILKTDNVVRFLTKKLSLPYLKVHANNLLGSNYKIYRSQGYRAGKDQKSRIIGEKCQKFYTSSMNRGKNSLKIREISRYRVK